MIKHEKVLLQTDLNLKKSTLGNKEGALGNHILATAQSVCISHRIQLK